MIAGTAERRRKHPATVQIDGAGHHRHSVEQQTHNACRSATPFEPHRATVIVKRIAGDNKWRRQRGCDSRWHCYLRGGTCSGRRCGRRQGNDHALRRDRNVYRLTGCRVDGTHGHRIGVRLFKRSDQRPIPSLANSCRADSGTIEYQLHLDARHAHPACRNAIGVRLGIDDDSVDRRQSGDSGRGIGRQDSLYRVCSRCDLEDCWGCCRHNLPIRIERTQGDCIDARRIDTQRDCPFPCCIDCGFSEYGIVHDDLKRRIGLTYAGQAQGAGR